jgi:hypothetical protein
MKLVGDEAEQAVAEHLSLAGFELVYQSRASRGAFDLLATRGPHQLGVQVKRTPLPVRFTRAEWGRMVADAKLFGWRWVIAAVIPPKSGGAKQGASIMLLDPKKVRGAGETRRLGAEAAIQNILLWLERARARRP